ncbi:MULTISPECIES: PTS cellobiose transporter subunit IIC [unclassified Gilliamella]|uniref:PTS cellobiose transporter subunit IIC n=1 Tax=unclassified Gilliamella TaxID=2685620 RepID=UPI00226992A4|nr:MULTISPECIES: PTS cellobiose transporter subunit IIC [unclassified Gilliamella]MCX8580305.1 PTS cellobiose transporter subunit IIC [Gilliamella sp. B3482]MCX8659374.1 PTS cellobiose transporter subunit IIC [Gilliamella sp. B2772]MCX8662847.1 PTS cellobiose transporter subunit IIC [Gilliamella sp. B2911]MCX8670055.1 PTS cellobiose transporter subunit IIC [Gilliamella sp. B2785]MCX8675247.1 PTS cellobiose transporter subunit IIC [Gilliamella sp. B3023]
MNTGFVLLQKYLMTPMAKISQFKIVRAVMAAGMASVPFCIVGSMFLVFNTLPMTFTGLETLFQNTIFKVSDLYMIANTATMGILALYFNIVVGYELTKIEEEETGLKVNALNGAMLSVFAFVMTLPELVLQNGSMVLLSDQSEVFNGLRLQPFVFRLGTSGIFIAIVMAIVATQLYFLCVRRNWVVKMPETVPLGVSRSFTALIPTFVIAFTVIILNGILIFFGTDIFDIIGVPFTFVTNLTKSWLGIMVILFLIHALWVVGIHGASIIGAFITPIMLANMNENVGGAHIPFAGEFNNSLVILGGSGSTLLMTFFIAFCAKSSQLKILGRASAVPAIFNINEPIIFGMPIVYNPYLAIPFLLAPMACGTLGYFAISSGFMNPIIALVPWPSPMGLGAFIGTGGDYRAMFVAILSAILALVIYLPFVKMYDNKLYKEEQVKSETEVQTEE